MLNTSFFQKRKFPIYATRNVPSHLKSTVCIVPLHGGPEGKARARARASEIITLSQLGHYNVCWKYIDETNGYVATIETVHNSTTYLLNDLPAFCILCSDLHIVMYIHISGITGLLCSYHHNTIQLVQANRMPTRTLISEI